MFISSTLAYYLEKQVYCENDMFISSCYLQDIYSLHYLRRISVVIPLVADFCIPQQDYYSNEQLLNKSADINIFVFGIRNNFLNTCGFSIMNVMLYIRDRNKNLLLSNAGCNIQFILTILALYVSQSVGISGLIFRTSF